MESEKLPRLTCLTWFTCTSHPVHCVPLLTPGIFGFQNERNISMGNTLFPIWVLSHGIDSHTLYAVLQQNPSSKLNSKPHYSSQPWTKLLKFFRFRCQSSPPPRPPRPHFMLTCLYRSVHAPRVPVCSRTQARVYMLSSKWMCILLNCIICRSMLSLFLLLYAPWAVKIF